MAGKDIMIRNFWGQLTFVCDCHPENIMSITPKGKNLVYQCEHCNTSVPYYDVEKFVNKVQKILVDDAEDDSDTNLTNYKHTLMSRIDGKRHTFKVLSHNNNKMKVSIQNG